MWCLSLLDSRSPAEQIFGAKMIILLSQQTIELFQMFFFLADLKLSDVLIVEPTLEFFFCILEAFILYKKPYF